MLIIKLLLALASLIVGFMAFIMYAMWRSNIRFTRKDSSKADWHIERHVKNLNRLVSRIRIDCCNDYGEGVTTTVGVTYGIWATIRITPLIEELTIFSIKQNERFTRDLVSALKASMLKFELVLDDDIPEVLGAIEEA